MWQAVEEQLVDQFGPLAQAERLAGGCINHTYCLTDIHQRRVVVKRNHHDRFLAFTAEADGLHALATTQTVRVPHVLAVGTDEIGAFLVLEYIAPCPTASRTGACLGSALAALHRHTRPTFGWNSDNDLGLSRQPNASRLCWRTFWREQRLGFQLQQAQQRDAASSLLRRGQSLLDALDDLLADHQPQPALLHGDLWSGNWFIDVQGRPVLFDPAVYYCDRECDLAMTGLFGGRDHELERHYTAHWPLPKGHERRHTLYNLYHILNHFNQYGGAYRYQAEAMIDALLALD